MSSNPYEIPEVQSMPTPVVGWSLADKVILTLAGIGGFGLLVALLLPMHRTAPEAARRSQCQNNLKQIALALQNYHDVYKSFPPAYTVDEQGMKLHSWRTLILPYLDQKALYDTIDLSKPWNHPANKSAYNSGIYTYHCPSVPIIANRATYLAVVGPRSIFPGSQPITMNDVTDGLSDTLTVVDVDSEHGVHWMSPNDVDETWLLNIEKLKQTQHQGVVIAAMADGSIKSLYKVTKPETLRALITINGGEKISHDEF